MKSMLEAGSQHYLRDELYSMVGTNSAIFEFIQAGSLDGIWYQDLENPREQWMSPRFKEVFGYSDEEVPNTSGWWRQNIFAEDLNIVLKSIQEHCANPSHPFDQTVRYHHKNGSTVWVRCRGIAVRNSEGVPIRMLGAHTDVTSIKRTEERLRALCEASPDMYFVADLQSTVILEGSQQLEENTGWAAGPGLSLLELCHAQSLSAMHAALTSLQLHAEVRNVELNLRRANGMPLPVLLSASSAHAPETNRVLVRGWFRDISHLKLFANIEVFISALPTGIFLADNEGVISIANPAAEQLLGYQHGDLAGTKVTRLLPHLPDAPSAAFPADLTAIRKDGSRLPVRIGRSGIRLGEGSFQLFTVVDLTANKAMESALGESEFRFRQLTECLPQLVWTCTPDGRRDYLSPQWLAYTGLTHDAALGGAWVSQVHPDERESLVRAWRANVHTGQDFQYEYRLRGVDGVYRWFEARAVALRNADNEIIKWFGTSTDIHEARETRVELERERSRLANLVSLAPAVFCTFELKANGACSLPYAGEDFGELFGLDADEVRANPILITPRLHSDDSARVRAAIQASGAAMTPFRTELRILHPSRGECWIEAHFNPTGEAGGTVWHGFLNDITERKQAEADQRFLLQLGADLQAAADMNAIAEMATKTIANHFGLSHCSLNAVDMGRFEATLLHHYNAAGTMNRERTQPLGGWSSGESIKALVDGNTIVIDNTASHPYTAAYYEATFGRVGINAIVIIPLRRAGELTCILSLSNAAARAWTPREIALVRTVAELIWPSYEAARALAAERAMNETLAASEERLRIALQAASIGIWENNAISGERRWDQRAKAMFGFPVEQVIDPETVMACILPEDQELVKQHVMEYSDPNGTGHFEAAYRIISKDTGRLRHIFGQGQMFFEGEGEGRHPARAIGTLQDVTALKQGELALRRANKELEQFAYAAAHDLQEPLRNVGLAAQILSARYGKRFDGEADELLKIAVEGSRRMQDMVKDLLAYSRVLTADDDSLPVSEVNDAVALAVDNLRAAIREKDAAVSWENLPAVKMHQLHMVQILQNLISNSLKYSGTARPVIHICSTRQHNDYILQVRDKGVGIPAEFHDRAFGVFKRLHGRDIPGTGIGLALCKRIVEHYGGRIWIESKADEGTAVLFSVNAA